MPATKKKWNHALMSKENTHTHTIIQAIYRFCNPRSSIFFIGKYNPNPLTLTDVFIQMSLFCNPKNRAEECKAES